MPTDIVGLGLGGLGGLECRLLSEMDDVRVVAGADPDRVARRETGQQLAIEVYNDLDVMLDDHNPDAAVVATPHTLHYDAVTTLLEQGVDVHVEKPLVTDVGEAVDLVERTRESERVVQVGYQRRFDPRYRELRRLVDAGRIGEPQMGTCYLEQDWIRGVAGSWRTDPDLSGGGQLYDSGSHLLDALLWTTDARPREVAGLVDHREHDVDVDAALSVRLEREDGEFTVSVGVTANGTTGPDVGEHIAVFGTGGSFQFDGESVSVTERAGRGDYTAAIEPMDYVDLTRTKLEAFVEAVEDGGPSPVPPEDALQITALTEAAYRAAERGETVDAQAVVREARQERT